jgi:hypothetical protein
MAPSILLRVVYSEEECDEVHSCARYVSQLKQVSEEYLLTPKHNRSHKREDSPIREPAVLVKKLNLIVC